MAAEPQRYKNTVFDVAAEDEDEPDVWLPPLPPVEISLEQQRRPALLLVNMQNDFMLSGSLAVPEMDNHFVDKVNTLRNAVEWDLVMFSQIKHPNNHASFSSCVPGSKPFMQTMTKQGEELLLLPDHCVLGTYGAEFCERLEISQHDVVVETGLGHTLDDTGVFSTLDIHDDESIAMRHLNRADITDLFIAGVDIDGETFLATIDELFDSGIRVFIVADACKHLYKLDDLWDVVRELRVRPVTVDQIKSGSIVPSSRQQRNGGEVEGEFRVELFDEMLRLVSDPVTTVDSFMQFAKQHKAVNEMSKPHPSSGRYLIHYLTATTASLAAKIIAHLSEEELVDIAQPSEVDNLTPAMSACKAGVFENLNALLTSKKQASALELDVSDAYGRTAMMYAIMRREVETVALMITHPIGGKTLLRAQDMSGRNILLLACQHAGPDPRVSNRALHSKGEAVLDYLWEKFQAREFSDSKCDAASWTFWNYAVKHNLSKVLRRGLQMISSKAPAFKSSGDKSNKGAPKTTKDRRLSMQEVMNTRDHNSLTNVPQTNFPNLPGDLKVAFSQSKVATAATRAALRKKAKAVPTTAVGLRSVMTRTIGFGMNLLHQATWQRRDGVIPMLLSLYSREGLLQATTESGMSALDLTTEDVDPKWQFLLVKNNCIPKQTVGLPMYHMCIKALLLGEFEVVKNMVLCEEYGVTVDAHLLDIAGRARFINTCTATFSSQTAPLTQLSFSCSECEATKPGVVFCTICAFMCHKGHTGVYCTGTESFHCGCSMQVSCVCRKGTRTMEMPLESLKLNPQSSTLESMSRAKRDRGSVRRLSMSLLVEPPPAGTEPPPSPPTQNKEPKQNGMARLKTMKRSGTNASEASDAGALSAEEQAKAELQKLQAEMTYRDYIRHVFLMFAAKRGVQSVIEELVKYVKPDFPVDLSLDRPLHVAATTGNVATCSLLKHNGARVSATNTKGETPLHVAAQHGHVDVCQLIAHNSNMLKLDRMALSPLHHAIRNNNPAVVNFLAHSLRHKARVTLPLDDVFFQVTTKSRPGDKNACDASAVSRELLSLGPGECEGHASPLHLAVRYGKVECVTILMRHGASPLRVDATGFSPYQTAIWELYATRKRLESHQEFLRRQVGHRDGQAPKGSADKSYTAIPTGKGFFRFLQEAHASHIESQLEDLNKDLPADLQTLSPKVAHDLVDELGKATEVERTRRRFAYQYLTKWVLGYLLVLLLLLVFSLPRTNERHYMTRMVDNHLTRNGWSDIRSAQDAWNWTNSYLTTTNTLLPPVVFNTSTIGLQLFGAVRLRQVRAPAKTCSVVTHVEGASGLQCMYSHMEPSYEDKRTMSWNPFPLANDFPSHLQSTIENARIWRSGPGPDSTGDYGRFSQSGFYVDLDLTSSSPSDIQSILTVLQSPDSQGNTWFDRFTRLLKIDFSLYNVNFDTFCAVTLTLEAGAAGELKPTRQVLTHTLLRSPTDIYPSTGFKIATMGAVYFMLSGIAAGFVRNGPKSLRKSGTLFDLALAAVSLLLFVMDMIATIKVQDMDLDLADTSQFQSLIYVTQLLEFETYVIAVMLMLMWLRLIKYSVLLPKFGRVTYAFMNTMKNFEVRSYLLFVLFVIGGFLCSYRLAFGQVDQTSTYDGTLNLLMEMMMGEWGESVFVQLPSVMRTVMFISFMVVVAVIFINLFISVLSEVYPREKRRAQVQCNDNLTVLIERDFVMNTHSMLQTIGKHKNFVAQAIRAHIVVPCLRWLSVVLRLWSVSWNFDLPQTEFGWEKGREFFGVGLVANAVEDVAGAGAATA